MKIKKIFIYKFLLNTTTTLALIPGLSFQGLAKENSIVKQLPKNFESTDTNKAKDGEILYENYSENDEDVTNAAMPNHATSNVDDTIIVTGSHIRGLNTTVGNQSITIDREEIERQNYATVRDLTDDLPQNFGGGATGERQFNTGANYNTGFGASINLRGLGNTATLILVNGRRMPASGYAAGSADISGIPLAAIERVDVLPDGASAVYGSDAVAGVVNFVLKKRYSGAETNARFGGATESSFNEYQISQSGGTDWNSGSLFGSYEYYRSDRLRRTDRPFTNSADLRRYGGLDYRQPFANPANIINPLTFQVDYVIPPNQDGRNLTPAMLLPPEQARLGDIAKFQDTFPEQRRHSVFAYLTQDLASNFQLFAEVRYSHRKFNYRENPPQALMSVPSTNPFYVDAYGDERPLFLWYSFENEVESSFSTGHVEAINGAFGLDWQHTSDWSTATYVAYTKDRTKSTYKNAVLLSALQEALANSDPEQAINPFGHGKINSPSILADILYDHQYHLNAKLWQVNLTTSGNLFTLFGNQSKGALGAEYRKEDFSRWNIPDTDADRTKLKRDVWAGFAEFYLPFIAEANERPAIRRLELSFSLRHERFEDTAALPQQIDRSPQSSTNPRIGVLYEPFDGISLNGSYGTSFRAPALSALTSRTQVSSASLPNPSSPAQTLYGLIISGSEKDLDNETADTWTVGLEVSHALTSFINFNINYFNLKFKDQVGMPPGAFTGLADPAFRHLGITNPTLEQVQATCQLVGAQDLKVGTNDCTTPGIVTFIYDNRERNLSKTSIQGIDLQFSIPIKSESFGQFIISGLSTYLIDYKIAVSPGAPYVERVNTGGHPLEFRGRGSLTWETPQGVVVNTDVNYINSYRDDVMKRRIDSWTTVDIGLAYYFPPESSGSILKNVNFRITANNIFNNDPPFYEHSAFGLAYDPTNADPHGRLLAVSISKKW